MVQKNIWLNLNTEVSEFLNVNPRDLMKSLIYVNREEEPILILLRGDHELNETKLGSILNTNVRLASAEEVNEICGVRIGFVGPIGLKKPVRIIADEALKDEYHLITGANAKDYHLKGVELVRDCKVDSYYDIRNVLKDERCLECSGTLRIVNAIELGHIKFKDADLLGFPFKIIIGDRWLTDKNFEIQRRSDKIKIFVNERDICSTIRNLFNEAD